MNYEKFEEYIDFLKETVVNVVEYRERTGTSNPELSQLRDNLFDEDPFVVFGASVLATAVLADKTLYH
ncbi:MAG: hypothetical protein JWM09_902 [Francisellaceae bacterium]|nr:hypothetical protein [Francisellaceae bacterium]